MEDSTWQGSKLGGFSHYLYDIHWMGSINMNEYEVSLKNVAVHQVWDSPAGIFFNISTSINNFQTATTISKK
jgi:hypothetical protein